MSRLLLLGTAVFQLSLALLYNEWLLGAWLDLGDGAVRAIRDSQLVLGVSAHYEGAWVEINDKGLIGPEIPYSRRSDALRILYLGDSVTFG